jgi:hypothetical protein
VLTYAIQTGGITERRCRKELSTQRLRLAVIKKNIEDLHPKFSKKRKL